EVEMADYTSQEEYDAATTDAVARKQEYGEQRTDTTRAFLRTVTPLLRTGQAQWDLGVLYSTNELTLPVLLPGPVANNQLYQIRTLDSILGFRYGVTDRLQWNGSTQVGWQNTQVTDGLTLTRDNAGGIGDLKTGFNYLLYRETECRPAVIASFDLTAPTGNGRNPIAPGNAGMGLGVWTFASDILMVKAYDPLVLFWGAGYRHYAEGRFGANYIKPGDSFQYNFGTGFGVNERVTLSAALLGSYALETQLNSQSLAGTNADIISLRLAATMIKRCNIVEPFVNFGITDRAPDATLGVVWTW
ncbi:MAG: transporter, partial [Planctomycetales bacterium]|nr:transporter [Planctomycetales bacterium]